MNKYLKKAGNIHLSYYIQAAEKLGIDYEIIVKGLIAKFKIKNKSTYIINTVTPINSIPSGTISKRKYLTSLILNKGGFPVPLQESLKSKEDAIKFFNKYKEIVIKPSQALGGHGVSILPKDKNEVEKAFKIALENSHSKEDIKVIGEEFIHGDNYRFLVLGESVIGIVKRNPAYIVGDGKLKICDLIEKQNKIREKKGLAKILIDDECIKFLSQKGLSINSIPKPNEQIFLRFNANLTTGGTTEECSKIVHKYYKDLAINAVKEIGLKLGGLDLIAEDITKPGKCAINEINYNPGLRPHYKPDKGKIVEVAVPIMKYIFKFISNQK